MNTTTTTHGLAYAGGHAVVGASVSQPRASFPLMGSLPSPGPVLPMSFGGALGELPHSRAAQQLEGNEYFARTLILDSHRAEEAYLFGALVQSFAAASVFSLQRVEYDSRISIMQEEAAPWHSWEVEHYPYRPAFAHTPRQAEGVEAERRGYVASHEAVEWEGIASAGAAQHWGILVSRFDKEEAEWRADIAGYESVDWRSLWKAHRAEREAALCEFMMREHRPWRRQIVLEEEAMRETLGELEQQDAVLFRTAVLERDEKHFRGVVEHDWGSRLAKLQWAKLELHKAILEGVEVQWRLFFERERARELRAYLRAHRLGCEGLVSGTLLHALEEEELAERGRVEEAYEAQHSHIVEFEGEQRVLAVEADDERRRKRGRRVVSDTEKMARKALVAARALEDVQHAERKMRGALIRRSTLEREEMSKRVFLEWIAVQSHAELLGVQGRLAEEARAERRRASIQRLGERRVQPPVEPVFYLSPERRAAVRGLQGAFITGLPLSHGPVHAPERQQSPATYPPFPDVLDAAY